MEMKIAAVVSIIFSSICTGLGVEVCTTPGCLELASLLNQSIDTTVEPCDDFYNFVCGGYVNTVNVTHEDSSIFGKITLEETHKAKAALEADLSDEDPEWAKKVKNFYRSCLDTARREKYSVMQMKSLLKKIGRWPLLDSNWNETDFNWIDVEERLHNAGLPTKHFFDLFMDWNDNFVDTIGLDARSHQISSSTFLGGMDKLKSYLEAIVGIAVIFGADRQQAEKDMLEVLQFEIDLANLTISGAADAPKMKISELQEAWPYIQWLDLMLSYIGDDLNITEDETVDVYAPFYFEHLGELISNTSKRVLANYIMARLLLQYGIHFNAEARNLTYGVLKEKVQSPPEQCFETVRDHYFIALEALYVRKYITPKKKEDVTTFVNILKEELIKVIETTDWISNNTATRAIRKIKSAKYIILYPDELLNDTILNDYYKNLKICPWNMERNLRALQKWTQRKDNQQLHHQDWKRWDFVYETIFVPDPYVLSFGPYMVLIAPTGNALLFSTDRPMYMNVAALGRIAGHEITHLVDSTSRYLNETGQPEDWWDSVSDENYLKKQHALADEYSSYVLKGINMSINGNSCIKEIIADHGGTKITRNAVDTLLQTPGNDQRLPGLEQYSPYQIYWMASGLVNCAKIDREDYIEDLQDGGDPPFDWRVRGPNRNSPQFAKDWNCPVGSFMNPKNKFNVW